MQKIRIIEKDINRYTFILERNESLFGLSSKINPGKKYPILTPIMLLKQAIEVIKIL